MQENRSTIQVFRTATTVWFVGIIKLSIYTRVQIKAVSAVYQFIGSSDESTKLDKYINWQPIKISLHFIILYRYHYHFIPLSLLFYTFTIIGLHPIKILESCRTRLSFLNRTLSIMVYWISFNIWNKFNVHRILMLMCSAQKCKVFEC